MGRDLFTYLTSLRDAYRLARWRDGTRAESQDTPAVIHFILPLF